MNVGKLFAMIRAHRAGAPLGDVVVMKLDALATPAKEITAKLVSLQGYAPEQNLTELRALSAGTLGREYARFLDDHGITPLAVSPALRARFAHEPYALRYTATHDLHHVLSGFDTGLAGEAGVLAFNVGQGTAPVGQAMLWLVRLLYTLTSPLQARAIANNVRVGFTMGRQAELVMAARLESFFHEPLVEVRRRLHVPDPRAAGVLPSGRSLAARYLLSGTGAMPRSSG